MIQFTPDELYKNCKVDIIQQNIVPSVFDDKQLPNDLHYITYSVENKTFTDAVRGYNKVDIFDVYWDKLKSQFNNSKPYSIVDIENGHGLIKPRLYGKIGKK